LGEDSDEILDVLPVQWRVIRTIRPKYSCRACEKIVQAPARAKAVARGKASFGTLAHVVVSKFDHHLPLYRQAEMMAAQGLDIIGRPWQAGQDRPRSCSTPSYRAFARKA
jgi:transposase